MVAQSGSDRAQIEAQLAAIIARSLGGGGGAGGGAGSISDAADVFKNSLSGKAVGNFTPEQSLASFIGLQTAMGDPSIKMAPGMFSSLDAARRKAIQPLLPIMQQNLLQQQQATQASALKNMIAQAQLKAVHKKPQSEKSTKGSLRGVDAHGQAKLREGEHFAKIMRSIQEQQARQALEQQALSIQAFRDNEARAQRKEDFKRFMIKRLLGV